MSNVQTFMFERVLFYEIRSSVGSLAYSKSVMFFTVLTVDSNSNSTVIKNSYNWKKYIKTVDIFKKMG